MKAAQIPQSSLRTFLELAREFYNDPLNVKAYEEWLEERKKKQAADKEANK